MTSTKFTLSIFFWNRLYKSFNKSTNPLSVSQFSWKFFYSDIVFLILCKKRIKELIHAKKNQVKFIIRSVHSNDFGTRYLKSIIMTINTKEALSFSQWHVVIVLSKFKCMCYVFTELQDSRDLGNQKKFRFNLENKNICRPRKKFSVMHAITKEC